MKSDIRVCTHLRTCVDFKKRLQFPVLFWFLGVNFLLSISPYYLFFNFLLLLHFFF